MKHKCMCFSIIQNDGKEEVDEVPSENVDILREFSYIVLDNVPDGLPPMRNISHQMHFTLGANFPNKATNKMTPVESEELNRQVHELL